MRAVLSLSVSLAVVAGASLASAQDLASPQVSTTQAAVASNSGGGGEITSTAGMTDHAMVVGHLGLRYLGSVALPALPASGVATGTLPSNNVQTIGLRYWLNNNLGIEGGIAFGVASGSTTTTTQTGGSTTNTSSDNPAFVGFGLQVGVPIMLAESKHLSINITPFLAFHHGSSSITTGMGDNTTDNSLGSNRFSVGGNAVAELQFGFLGLPQLGLQAQFGLQLAYQNVSYTSTVVRTNNQTTAAQSAFSIATTLGPSYALADILSGSLSAIWYFGYTPGTAR